MEINEKMKTKNLSVTLKVDAVEYVKNLAYENGLSFSGQINLLVKNEMKRGKLNK